MVMEHFTTEMVQNMKDSGKIIRNMVMHYILNKMEMLNY